MNTKQKNVVKLLLEINAERYNNTFGKYLSWEINRVTQNPEGKAKWTIDVLEQSSTGASHYYKDMAQISEAALISSYMTFRGPDMTIIKFNLY